MFKKIVLLIIQLFFIGQMDVHAMYVTKSSNVLLKNGVGYFRFHHATPSKILSKESDLTMHGICDYKPEHFEAVKKIAKANITALSTIRFGQRISTKGFEKAIQNALEEDVLPAFEKAGYINKVYLVDGIPVGFINYVDTTIPPTFFNTHFEYLPESFKEYRDAPLGYIAHLAVDEEYQKNGYGTNLIEHALQDCESKSVNYVTLNITEERLIKYYKKFGFEVAANPDPKSYSGSVWTLEKRFKPHPMAKLKKDVTEWLRNKWQDE